MSAVFNLCKEYSDEWIISWKGFAGFSMEIVEYTTKHDCDWDTCNQEKVFIAICAARNTWKKN